MKKHVISISVALLVCTQFGSAQSPAAQFAPLRTLYRAPLQTTPPPIVPPTFSVRVIAETGNAPPAKPSESFSFFTDPNLNDEGLIVFKAGFNGPSSGNEGIYQWIPTTENLIRIVDDSFDFNPPGQSGATSWTSLAMPVINQSSQVLAHGSFSFGDNSQGLYVFKAPGQTVIFDDSPLQVVPGHPSSFGFTIFPFTANIYPILSDNGFGATTAHFRDAGFIEREGLYLGSNSTGIVRVGDTTQSPPGQPGAVLFTAFDWFMSTNGSGDLAFHATYGTGNGNGLYKYDRQSATVLRIADRTMTPPGQASFARYSLIDDFPSIVDSGAIAFRSQYIEGAGNQGIYRGDGINSVERIVDNSGMFVVPEAPGANFTAFGTPAQCGNGDIVFSAVHTAGSGLYISARGAIEKVVDFTDPVPGQPGATFFAIGNVSANDSGHLTFAARYSGGTGNEGLYFFDGTGLYLVIDESDVSLGLTLTNLHVTVTTGNSGGEDGKPNALNASDSISFRATTTTGEVIMLATKD